jgi:hypothetical protein
MITSILEVLRKDSLSDDDEDNDSDPDEDNECDDDLDSANDNDYTILAHIELARTVRECIVICSFHNIHLDTEQRLAPADFAAKSNYPSSQSLFNISYTTNCTLKVILHHLMYHSVLVLFSQGKSHCFHLLLRRSMPQVTQVGFMVYIVSR